MKEHTVSLNRFYNRFNPTVYDTNPMITERQNLLSIKLDKEVTKFRTHNIKPVFITIRDGFYNTFENIYTLWDIDKRETSNYEFPLMTNRDGVQVMASIGF